jgi:phosphinothricin acetyltransferase
MTDAAIRPVTPADAAAIADIYNHYVTDSIVTFEEAPVTAQEMAGRIAAVTARYPWLVAARDGAILGYSYAARFHDRAGYRHTVSTTVYLDRHLLGQGLGAALYGALLGRLPALGVHAAIGTISWPNPASVALHEKMGFTTVGRLPQIGFKFGNWIDVVYLHRTFDAP